MSRPRGVGGGSDALSAVNKENPGKTAATSIGGAPLNRRPLQPCGNTAANRTTKTPAAKADDAGESAAGAEEGVDEMPPREFDGLCYSCEDDEWWKQEMHTACEALRDLNGQWNVRMKTLTRLRYLVMAREKQAGLGRPQLAVLLAPPLRQVLAIQLTDRRSILLREACITIGSFARLGDALMPMFADLLPSLFKNLIITTKAIVESSHKCVLTWIRHHAVQSIAYLPLIVDGLRNEHPMLRARCAEYVAELLEKETAPHALRDEGDRLEAAVQKALIDGDGEVRVMARRAYHAFTSLWPDRAQRIWGRLEYGTQRQLETERKERKVKGEKREYEAPAAPPVRTASAPEAQLAHAPTHAHTHAPAVVPHTVPAVAAHASMSHAAAPAPHAAAAAGATRSTFSRVPVAPQPHGSPAKRARVGDAGAPSLNLSRSLSLAANTAKMLSLAKAQMQQQPPQARPHNT